MSDKQFVDDDHTKNYSLYRHNSPVELIEKIISFLNIKLTVPPKLAVDVGCGSGQSTVILAPYFEQVYGLDVSEAQIKQAEADRVLPNVKYIAIPAEQFPFKDGSVQLVTSGCALHWFDMDIFLTKLRRVLCENGVLAVYGYSAMKPDFADPQQAAELDSIYKQFNQALNPYFLPNVHIMMNRYQDVNFPFEEIHRMPDVRCPFRGCLADIVKYVSTFSGLQNYRKASPKLAEECLQCFKNRLYEIGAACNISPEEEITLYRDYLLILCRKTNS